LARALDIWAGASAADVSLAIVSRLKLLLQSYTCIAAYQPLKSEPNLSALYSSQESAHGFVFSKVEKDDLHFYQCPDDSAWVAGPFGVREPNVEKSQAVSLDKIQAFIVPGLAFDRRLFRLGRGKGYYDRTLVRSNAVKIGVCASAQVLNYDMPTEPHDHALDFLVTENYVLKIENKIEFKQEA
jgi:5-formyltetrahydrofolate cyclo-ligase